MKGLSDSPCQVLQYIDRPSPVSLHHAVSECGGRGLVQPAARLLHQDVRTGPETHVTEVLAYQSHHLNTPTSALSLSNNLRLTSWSALDSSVLFCIFLRKLGSTPEFAGENSPSVSLSSSECPVCLLPGEELLEAGEFRWPWIFIAFLFRRSPEGLLGLLPASSWIIIPETEGKSSEFRTRLRGGDDIY